jgi:hypothetical protein
VVCAKGRLFIGAPDFPEGIVLSYLTKALAKMQSNSGNIVSGERPYVFGRVRPSKARISACTTSGFSMGKK